MRTQSDGRNAQREPGPVVRFDGDSGQGRLARSRLQPRTRGLLEESPDRFLLLHAQYRVVIAAHAGIRDIGSPALEHAVVGRRHMGMSADHEARASVEMMPE